MKKYALIVAGGSGARMGAGLPKQFLTLKGKPLLYHTITAFLSAYHDLEIILVLPEDHIAIGKDILKSTGLPEDQSQIITGGSTRFHSVQNGLKGVKEESIVFVHDGVRCMISSLLIQACFEQAMQLGSAIPAVAATDSIRIIAEDQHAVADRNTVRIIQTPQTFRSDILLEAFKQPYNEAFTDEATVVEANGEKIYLIEGEYNNIKITRPVDLLIAESLLGLEI